MQQSFDATHAGMSMFLVGDNGSEEDPQTNPTVVAGGSENHQSTAEQYKQALATGAQFAAIASRAAASATRLNYGTVKLVRQPFCVPLENNGFIALAAAGEFGRRQAWVCSPSGQPLHAIPHVTASTVGLNFRTFVSFADIGPDFQFIDNPAESFPALMLGSPFGVEEESCPRPNPSVPTWQARGLFRFQVGLADDLIGYMIPPWAFASGTPGLFNNDTCYQDAAGHGHKLESEAVGPTAAADLANTLSGLLDREPDPSAEVSGGRFVTADGKLSRWPTDAVGVVLDSGEVIGGPSTSAFGGVPVGARGVLMDYDGQPQAKPDVTTRGIMVLGADGCVVRRVYLNVFPDASAAAKVAGPAVLGSRVVPAAACPALMRNGVPELQPGAAAAAGLPVPSGTDVALRRTAGR